MVLNGGYIDLHEVDESAAQVVRASTSYERAFDLRTLLVTWSVWLKLFRLVSITYYIV